MTEATRGSRSVTLRAWLARRTGASRGSRARRNHAMRARKSRPAPRKKATAARTKQPPASKKPTAARTKQPSARKKGSRAGAKPKGEPQAASAGAGTGRDRGRSPFEDPQEMLTTGALMAAASVVRVGLACVELWQERLPSLIELDEKVRDARKPSGPEQGQLREELMAIARESPRRSCCSELHRGLEDLDTFTRPEEPPAPQAQARPTGRSDERRRAPERGSDRRARSDAEIEMLRDARGGVAGEESTPSCASRSRPRSPASRRASAR